MIHDADDPEREALNQAQDLVYDAWESHGATRLRLARKALEVSEDCADAYVILASVARSPHEARLLYAEGVRAGERSLGADLSHYRFWLDLDTRPYMRARLGLAETSWRLGKRAEAVGHASGLLQLNPDDNQGVRCLSATWLQVLGNEKQLDSLLSDFAEDESTWLAYARALLAFSREGDSHASRVLLRDAVSGNELAPRYLSGELKHPKGLPDLYSAGSDEEAVLYTVPAKPAWETVEGALEWLSRVAG